MRTHTLTSLTLPALLLLATASPARAADPVTWVRVYTLDCGHIQFKDMMLFSDTGDLDGKPGTLVDTCYVIRHPKGTLLWDTGLPDQLAGQKDGVDALGGLVHLKVEHTLADQLGAIGLKPADITYVAFSHFHFDHTGNANAFGGSTWIINKAEVAWATATPPPPPVQPDSLTALKTAKTEPIDGDHDVFGDGSVKIIKAPGHTPGHQVLVVKLKKSGNLILSGDLYHSRDNRKQSRVPGLNTDRADSLASMNRVEGMIKALKARFVIQHDPDDVKGMPKLPAFLE